MRRVPALTGPRGASVRFVLAFALVAGCLLGLYYFPYAEGGTAKKWLDAYLHGYAASAGMVLSWLEPHIEVTGQTIVGRYSLRIVRTCDAMDVTILLLAAVLSWPSPWRRRLVAAAIGIGALFVVNIVRICSLYYVGIYFPSSFELAHLEIWPAVILLVALGIFLGLIGWERRGVAQVGSGGVA
jgi:exosortase/archaeosortase family protein